MDERSRSATTACQAHERRQQQLQRASPRETNAVQFPSGVLRRATRAGNETVQGDVRNKPENSIKAARHRLGGLAGDFESNFTTKIQL